jgi:hypothetical protein
MSAAQSYSDPIARVPYVRSHLRLLSRLVEEAGGGEDRVDWAEVRRAVDEVLEEMARTIQIRQPGVQSRSGANQSPALPLYVYRVFEPSTGAEVDPIVVGVAFKHGTGAILVRGDFCGEESGHIYFGPKDCRQEVPERQQEVIEAASRVAARLAREIDRLLQIIDQAEPV